MKECSDFFGTPGSFDRLYEVMSNDPFQTKRQHFEIRLDVDLYYALSPEMRIIGPISSL